MDNDLLYYLGFSYCLGIGPMRLSALLKRFGDVEKAYKAPKKEIVEVIGFNIAEKFDKFRILFDPVKKLEELKKKRIEAISIGNNKYPKQLRQIPDPPICLYIRGDFNNFNFNSPDGGDYFIGIVGTRKPTPYGEQVAKKFSYELASAGFVIVSGMAVGIDSIAHKGALDAGGKTIAVLGCGVDIVYPAVNRGLYENIIRKGGIVISEFPPGHLVLKGLFIARNRIISGLSKGVLVVEGLKDSGAMITARYAGEQGKEVFAPPGPITSEFSQAPNNLLKQGAKLVTSVEDILEEFNLKIVPKKKEDLRVRLSVEEVAIFDAIISEPKLADKLSILLNQPINQILNLLSVLEIKNVVEKNSEGKYQIKNL